jgi:hypothetical protein
MIRPNRRRWRRTLGAATIAAGLVAAGTAVVILAPTASAATAPFGNLSEALQKSLYFYDAEKSGPARSLDRQPLEWRGDSEPSDAKVPLVSSAHDKAGTNLSAAFINQWKSVLDPDGDGTVDLSGGMHDAGDHVKFGLPQTYAAATLGWGVYEFTQAFKDAHSYDHAMDELYWFSDYLLRSTFRDPATKDVIAFNYMVGNGTIDHTYWGPPELQDAEKNPRPAMFAWSGAPASDQAAGAAAALTVMHLNTKGTDPTYAAKCLDTAKALYAFAVKYRGMGASDGFYNSSFDEDEMSWAAVWLYLATGTQSYLTDIVGTDANGRYTGYLKKIIAGPQDNWQNIWVHSWDTVWGGVFAKLAPASDGVLPAEQSQKLWYYFRWNVEYWTGGDVKHEDASDGNYMKKTPAGFQVINTWGSARYNTAAQLCALVFRKYAPDHPNAVPLTDWALGQMNYIMGSNPLKRSYIVGFAPSGTTSVQHPHHRAAHGSLTNSMLVPAENRHTLWGALAGGPDAGDKHVDDTTDFVYNEVAIDYNAAFVGALAGLYQYYGSGQANTRWTPPAEPTEPAPYASVKLEQENAERSQVSVQINNYGTHPPRFESDLSLRYYFNISELMEHGQTIDDVSLATYYDESASLGKPAKVTGPIAADAASGVYYVDVSWAGVPISGKRELQFALVAGQDSSWKSWWSGANDWGHTGITSSYQTSTYVPVYRAGVKVSGNEPGQGGPGPTPTATASPGVTVSPTASPTAAPVSVKAQYAVGSASATSGDVRFRVNVVNTGSGQLDLTKLKVRYWYTKDNSAGQRYQCDYAVVGCANVTGAFGAATGTGADSYLEIGFGSGRLGAGASTGEIQNRFHHDDWTMYTQTGDYSFDAARTSLSDFDRITVTYNGTLVWGVTP